MNSILIRSVTIADPGSSLNGKTMDVLVKNGVFSVAGKDPEAADTQIDGKGMFLSPGWIDSMAYCGEPGEEWKEDLGSLARTAAAGGFTKVAAFCGHQPFPDKATAITSILKKSQDLPAGILPLGAATKNREGKQMAELYDMRTAGAVAFTDGEIPINHSGLKARIMEYAANCGAPFIDFAYDPELNGSGTMHDGPVSNSLGLKGIPEIAEVNALSDAIRLAAWLKTPLRVACISTASSVELIRQAKKSGLEVYVSVPVMNLLFTDADLNTFDENYKVMPPLRLESDRNALISGLIDGTIDAVCSNHQPQDSENKDVEFDYAAFGAISLQVLYGMLLKSVGNKLSPDLLVNLLYYGPVKILGIVAESIEPGKTGDFTLFSNSGNSIVNKQNNLSKSSNSPVFGVELPGTVAGTIHNGKWNPKTHSATNQ